MSSPMRRVSSLLSRDIADYLTNQQTWGDIVINVRSFGAKGDGVTDDTLKIQEALNKVPPSGGTVLFPDGIFMIDVLTSLKPKSNTELRLSPGTVLKAITNSSSAVTAVIKIERQENITISGGTIEGERLTHIGTTGEWGMGIELRGARNISISLITIKDCWGDSVYIGSFNDGTVRHHCVDVSLTDVYIDNARRNGISIIALTGGSLNRCTIARTNGTAPQAGIDIEPNTASESVTGLKIVDCNFISNAAGAIEASAGEGFSNRDFLISGCDFVDNLYAIGLAKDITNVQFVNNKVRKCRGTTSNSGPILISQCNNVLISGNEITDNNRGLATLANCNFLTITANNFFNNGGANILIQAGNNILISHNNIYNHGSAGIRLTALPGLSIGSVSIKDNKTRGGNSLNSSSNASGIWLSSCQNVDVVGNTCLGDGVLTRYGIFVENATAIGNFLSNNYCYSGGITNGIRDNGSNTVNGGNVNNDGTFSTTPN